MYVKPSTQMISNDSKECSDYLCEVGYESEYDGNRISLITSSKTEGNRTSIYARALCVLERITTEFPHILFESCSGGGGRFDPGMLYYMPQTWTSDNSDAVSRLKIQYGTSMVYPTSTMGAHVSAVPNHQVHRMTSLDMRGHVAMSGNFGYELDLN